MRNELRAALLALGFLAASAAWADGSVDLGQVVVTDTGSPVSRLRIPDNTVRLDALSLSLIDATHPAQLFGSVPGAYVSINGGQESLISLRSPLLTGVGACGAFLLLEDGLPIQPAGFCDDNALFWLDTEQANAVEVIRGPGSVLYGGNALHGIVNVFTLPPDMEPPERLSLEHGSHGYSRVKASLGYWDGARGFRTDSGYDQQKLTLRYDSAADAMSKETLLAATNLNQKTAGYIYGQDAYQDES
ncbi:MAG TPA: TonB-dependent receptor plug domain-containing protein, partial [Gammaproteobacteria bacterium]|nr:TonB-dependent receptor plug domain-containing protein [Gammaproteobacteria bacterium]